MLSPSSGNPVIYTQVAALRLASARERGELEKESGFVQALQRTRAEPGYTDLIWDVTQEDNTILVLIMKRDSFAAPETQGVQQTGLHYPYIGYLSEYLSPESPVILINHFTLTPCPGELLSEVQPCLEIFCPKLKSGFAAHHLREAFAPMTAEWHKGSSRRNHISADALEPEDEGQVIFCVPWQSAEEHEEAATQEYFKQGVANADKLIDSVRLYGHLYPRP